MLLRSLPVRDAATARGGRLTARTAPAARPAAPCRPATCSCSRAARHLRGVGGFNAIHFDVGAAGGASCRRPCGRRHRQVLRTCSGCERAGRLLAPADDAAGRGRPRSLSDGYWAAAVRPGRPTRSEQTLPHQRHAGADRRGHPAGFTGATVGASPDITLAARRCAGCDNAQLLRPGNLGDRGVLARPRDGVSDARRPEARDARRARSGGRLPAFADQSGRTAGAKAKLRGHPGFRAEPRRHRAGGNCARRFSTPPVVLMATVVLVLLIASANTASLLLARARPGGASWRCGSRSGPAAPASSGSSSPRACCWRWPEEPSARVSRGSPAARSSCSCRRATCRLTSTSPRTRASSVSPPRCPSAPPCSSRWCRRSRRRRPGRRARSRRARAPACTCSRWLPALVSAQVALALVLLAGASLFARTLANIERLDAGFEAADVVIAELDAPAIGARDVAGMMAALPGVTVAAIPRPIRRSTAGRGANRSCRPGSRCPSATPRS